MGQCVTLFRPGLETTYRDSPPGCDKKAFMKPYGTAYCPANKMSYMCNILICNIEYPIVLILGCLGPGAGHVCSTFFTRLFDEKIIPSSGELVGGAPVRALADGGRVGATAGFDGLHPFGRAHRPHRRWPPGAALPTGGLAPGAAARTGRTRGRRTGRYHGPGHGRYLGRPAPPNGTGGVGSAARYGPWQYVVAQQLTQLNALPLPVVLMAFTATAEGPAAVRLAWATASEKNSAAFEV